MPVQYRGILQEHEAVRKKAGVFDISHMGEFRIQGSGALDFLSRSLTNDPTKLESGQGQYTLLPNDKGGVIDDLYLYRLSNEEFLAIVNASRIQEDWEALTQRLKVLGMSASVDLTNESDQWSALAVQGPNSRAILESLMGNGPASLKKNRLGFFKFEDLQLFVGCTGYTGEDGFEILLPNEIAEKFWDALLKAGSEFGLAPAGLGCRDTLRLEACFPLYGHELNETTSPIEAGLGWAVKCVPNRDFPSENIFTGQKETGPERKLVALEMIGKTPPPREGYLLYKDSEGGSAVGIITSGALSPTFRKGIAMGYITASLTEPGTELFAEIRNKRYSARVIKKPFYKKES